MYVVNPQNDVKPFFPPNSKKKGSRNKCHRPARNPAPAKSSVVGRYCWDAMATKDPTANPASMSAVYSYPVGSNTNMHSNAIVVGAWTGLSGIFDWRRTAPPTAERNVHATTLKIDDRTSSRVDQSWLASPYNDQGTAPDGIPM